MTEPGSPTGARDPAGKETEGGWTRRRFLKAGIASGLLLGIGVVVALNRHGYELPDAIRKQLKVLGAKEYLVIEAISARICRPDAPDAPNPANMEIGLAIDRYLAGMPEWLVSEVGILLNALEHSPILFTGNVSRFTRLGPDDQDACIRAWAASRADSIRRGYAAVKAMAMFGYYRHPQAWPLLGYLGPV